MPQGKQLRKCCLHTTPKLSAPAKRSIDWASWSTEFAMRVRRFDRPAPRDETPAKHGRLSRREGDTRFGQGPATEAIGTRGNRFFNIEANRLGQNHPSIRVYDGWKEIVGN